MIPAERGTHKLAAGVYVESAELGVSPHGDRLRFYREMEQILDRKECTRKDRPFQGVP